MNPSEKVLAEAEARVASYSIHRKLVASMILFLVLTILFAIFAPWQQTSRASGRVIAFSPNDRAQNIDSAVDGRISKWFVQEGTRVRAGDPIVEITDFDPAFLKNLTRERDALKRRVDAAIEATRTSKLNLDRQKELYDQGISSRKDYERANLDYVNLLAQEANASAELTRVEVRLSRQQNQLISAPRDGTILQIKSGVGGVTVKAGERLAVLVPDTDQQAVELWVDGNDLPLIYEGREVRLQFEGWPAIQFSGWPSIAVGTFGGRVSTVDMFDNGAGKFRILILPDKPGGWPEERYLRQGVRAIGWVLLNEVSVIYELWRQFNGFPVASDQAPNSETKK